MWKYYNANARGNNVNDCVVRAISKAEGKIWDKTYEELSKIAQYEGILLDDVDFVENYLDKRYVRQCHYSKTIRRICTRTFTRNFFSNNAQSYYSNYRWNYI